ncbi:hypothetical protein Lesp02_02920 [Lentzea sp. NBRC 105346]|uniref:hypothetical protein n=1 Tax=Lentzea sp. NBRC 105346 TaxID=3032205 RepID=UPI0024A5C833|nr:hypothetical protein [Lentzea sp. NBRC 105346]GLZ28102.1 hypothetical protein Lesp02_02920 [Lentzea sp. NBRC 105346]
MTNPPVLPEYTVEAANQPLPTAVIDCAAKLGRLAAHFVASDYPRPGQAFEWIVNNNRAGGDPELRALALAAGRWVEHGMFLTQFSAAFTAAALTEQTTGFVATNGVIGAEPDTTNAVWPIPAVLDRPSIQVALADTLARAYGGTIPTARDHFAAGRALDHVAAIAESLSYDGRIVNAASPVGAVQNFARLIGRRSTAHDAITG